MDCLKPIRKSRRKLESFPCGPALLPSPLCPRSRPNQGQWRPIRREGDGLYEEVEAAAIKNVIAAALAKQMERKGVSVSALAEKLGTSRAALNCLLEEDNTSITLTTFSRTAAALGCRLNLEIVAAR